MSSTSVLEHQTRLMGPSGMEEDGDPERAFCPTVRVQVIVGDEDAARIEAVSRILMSDSETARQFRQLLEHLLSQVQNTGNDDDPA
jgi:hypothetical protein